MRFVLTPCKVREDTLVPIKGAEALTLNWTELQAKVAPGGPAEIRKLQGLQPGVYLGLAHRTKTRGPLPTTWILLNRDRSGDIGWITKKDPGFSDRIIDAYRVDEVKWDSSVTELKPAPKR